jgi:hypothetical protein
LTKMVKVVRTQKKTQRHYQMKLMRNKMKEKPFYTISAKKRHWLNPLKYIFGMYKFNWFVKDKQPKGYRNAFDIYWDSVDLDINDIKFVERK